jgi:riboflavin kinase / FMN adenylyltransferase
MLLIRGLHNLKEQFVNGCVVTIGNYDGLHLGHQQILIRLKKKSEELKIPSVVIIFEPQPEEFFTGDRSLRLTSLREKISLFSEHGVDTILVLAFNSHFVGVTAPQFIKKTIAEFLRAKYLIVGDDFSFGHKREGGYDLLNQCASSFGFEVERVPAVKIEGVRISSSFIRIALLQGNLTVATRLLGRPYKVSGRVIHGTGFGRDLGFPTANIYLTRRTLPLAGVYAVKIHDVEKKQLYGVVNIGSCPTFSKKSKSFEVYIFNFDANIYGKRITIEFCEKIRDEQKFSSLEKLALQIKKDILKAKKILG